MPTAEKAKSIELAQEWYGKSLGVVFTDYRSLKVKEMQVLRKALRSKGGEIHIIKNTLFRRAAGDEVVDSLPAEFHNGTTAFTFVYENEPDVAKALVDFAKSSKKLVIKGGMFGGKNFSAEQVEELSKLPPKDVLIAQVIGTIVAPLSNLASVVEALYADPIRVIGAVADKVAEGSPLPAPSAASSESAAPASEAAAAAPAEAESAPEAEAASPEPASADEAAPEA